MECIFCDFVKGNTRRHRGRYPFMKLHDSKHTISFLSIDFPATEDGHILVIPKEHYANIEDIPHYILHDLIEHVSFISKILRTKNEANNILLNNGAGAGQCVFHTHFHLIPRNKGDKIKIEVWKSKEMTKEHFKKLHNKIKKQIKKHL